MSWDEQMSRFVTVYPTRTVGPPVANDNDNLFLVIGLCTMGGVGLLIATIIIAIVCVQRKKKLADSENEKNTIDSENGNNQRSVSAQRGSRHKSGNESNFNNLERLSKVKRNTRNTYETKNWERQYQEGASNFVTQKICHNEEEEDLAKYLIDDEMAEYDKIGHEQVSPSKETISDDAGYDHIAKGGASVTVIDSSGKVVKEGKDLAKYMVDNDMVEYDKLGNKKTSPSKLTTSDDAGYDHIAKAGDTVTIIDHTGQVVKQKAPKNKTTKTTSEVSPYDLALGEESPSALAKDEGVDGKDFSGSAKKTDDPYSMAKDETANGEYDFIGEVESPYDFAKSENNNSDIYDVAADVKTVKPLCTLAKATDDPAVMAKGEEDSEYAFIPDMNDEVYHVAADVKTNDSPYALTKDTVDQSDKDDAYDVAAVVKPAKPPLPLPKATNDRIIQAKDNEGGYDIMKDDVYDVAANVKTGEPEYALAEDIDDPSILAKDAVDDCEYAVISETNDGDLKSDESPYTMAEDTEDPYVLANEELQTAEYDSLGNKDSLSKVSNETSDEAGYDHMPKLDSKVIVVGLSEPGINNKDQNGKAIDVTKEESPYDLPEDVVDEKLEDPYTMADDDGIKNGYDSFGNNIRMSKGRSAIQGLMAESPYSIAGEDEDPYARAKDEETIYENDLAPALAANDEDNTYDVAVDVHQDRLELKTSRGGSQETDSTEEQEDGYYNTSEILKHVKLNGHLDEGANSPLSLKKGTGIILAEENSLYEKSPDSFSKMVRNDSYETWEVSPANKPKVKVITVENSLYEKATI